jgi:hypothetical protein
MRRWYHSFYYSYAGSATNFSSRTPAPAGKLIKRFATATHDLRLSLSQSIFRYLAVAPNFNYRENWINVFPSNLADSAGVPTNSPGRRGTFSLGIGALTNLYGTFPVKIGALQGLRHVVTPQVSFTYTPKFTRHALLASYVGQPATTAKSEVMGFSLGNLFQIKTRHKDQERKLEIANLNFSSGYNFTLTQRKLAPLVSSFRTTAVPAFGFEFNSVHDFYDSRGDLRRPKLLNYSITSTFTRRGTLGGGTWLPDTAKSTRSGAPAGIGFNLYLAHHFAKVIGGGAAVNQLRWSLDLALSTGWSLRYTQNYDFTGKQVAAQQLNIHRGLHCWEADFSWIPAGPSEGYYFVIRVKVLPEIKLEKSRTGLGDILSNFVQ